jgi:putative addiction module component (TIGR02574 family)
MSFDKKKIMQLPATEKRELAFELLDSIDEEYIRNPVPEWKKKLIKQRIENDQKNPSAVTSWSELRKKYSEQ